MKKNILSTILNAWKIVLGVAAILFLIVWSTGALKEKTAPGVVPHAAGVPVPSGADTITVKVEPIPTRLTVAGNVTSEDKINLSARVGGIVEEITVSAGDRVSKDQLLLRIDDREMRQQLAAAEAQLRRAISDFDRTSKLFAQNAATQQQLTDTESARDAAHARVQQVMVALSYHEIRSPIDGIITDRRIEQGDLAAPGQSLLAVYEPATMRLDVPVPVRLIDRLALDQEVRVSIDSIHHPITGTVSEIASVVDAASRTQLVKVRMAGMEAKVLPGTFGRLTIELDPHDGVHVPASAVFRVGQLEMVQVVRDGRAIRRMIRTGPVEDGRIEVLSGLSGGDVVLTQPLLDR